MAGITRKTDWPDFESEAVAEIINATSWGSVDPTHTAFEIMNAAETPEAAVFAVRDMLRWWHRDTCRGACGGECQASRAVEALNWILE